MDTIFLGHPIDYWLELQKKAEELNVKHLIAELAKAHGKIGFYEQRLREMSALLSSTT